MEHDGTQQDNKGRLPVTHTTTTTARPNYSLGNTYRRNGTTYIGREINKYYLGRGKPGHGQRSQQQRQQQIRNAWIQKKSKGSQTVINRN